LAIVKTQIDIAAPIQLCFDLARDIDIHTQTVWKHTRERAIQGITSGPIGYGQTVTFEATHFWIRQTLTSKITEFSEPHLFIDEMQRGAFKSIRHIHEFEQKGNKAIMKDTLYFKAPLGIVGTLVEQLILKRYMKRFLEHRNNELKILAEKTGADKG
jgi:ligand-binding SRPBCC domain-containing protein